MRASALAALVLVPVLSGCDTASQYACTEEFRILQVRIVNAVGQPVEGLAARSVLEDGGQVLDSPEPNDPSIGTDGYYPVASDADLDLLSIDGDPVVFTATGDGLRAEARYVLADDGCHVTREEGPTEITAVSQ